MAAEGMAEHPAHLPEMLPEASPIALDLAIAQASQDAAVGLPGEECDVGAGQALSNRRDGRPQPPLVLRGQQSRQIEDLGQPRPYVVEVLADVCE